MLIRKNIKKLINLRNFLKKEQKMSFDKAIEHKKEHRKQYRGAKLVDSFCRNHGACPWCRENRQYKNLKRLEKAKSKENEEKIKGEE